MKRCLRTILFLAYFVISIALSTLESDQTTIDGDHNESFGKPNISLCCRVGTFLTSVHGCIENMMNETEIVQLPAVYNINLALENITTNDEYFNFVIWNPCAGRERYPLDFHVYNKYLMSNGSILIANNLEASIVNYQQYCLARINRTEYRDYLAFLCMEKNDKVVKGMMKLMNLSYAFLVSVPFLIMYCLLFTSRDENRTLLIRWLPDGI
ncbi:uncharacterized protein [Anoplolepis gracilipes]|uniref:uncharacterized protein isoform X2 n=1 Tax=Anoplolepis gracilipes TaxID=354296 RepID=UPI003BA3D947